MKQSEVKPLVFISYAREDNKPRDRKEGWLDWLLKHLKRPLEQRGIDIFIDNSIITGEYSPVIKKALHRATGAVLLLSPDFMDSEYIIKIELPLLIARYKAKQLNFFPLLISPCAWDIMNIEYLDPACTDGTTGNAGKDSFLLSRLLLAGHDPKHPLSSMSDYQVDQVFEEVTKRILAYHDWRDSQAFTSEPTEDLGQEIKQPVSKLIKKVQKTVTVRDKPGWSFKAGVDKYGRYADFIVRGITERMRWIEPGEFLMGSPEHESERTDEETQHKVKLTVGFWLADTVCTQALWKAVMGDNPSCFEGARLPVEQVSWEDVQKFIQKINGLLDGLALRLPTEAQWEYACRAGTTTPFSFGENITPRQVNYNGNHPYNNGEMGEYREKTVDVKSLPPNSWGLYEMHGNVWEWCADWFDDYRSDEEIDPQGPETGDKKVIRGGSWAFFAWRMRSAYRFREIPSWRNSGIGFRLSRGQ